MIKRIKLLIFFCLIHFACFSKSWLVLGYSYESAVFLDKSDLMLSSVVFGIDFWSGQDRGSLVLSVGNGSGVISNEEALYKKTSLEYSRLLMLSRFSITPYFGLSVGYFENIKGDHSISGGTLDLIYGVDIPFHMLSKRIFFESRCVFREQDFRDNPSFIFSLGIRF